MRRIRPNALLLNYGPISKKIKSLKCTLSSRLKNIPVSSKFLGPPKGHWPTTENYSSAYQLRQTSVFHYEIFPNTVAELKLKPKTIYPKIHWKFSGHYQNHSTIFTVCLPRGRVVGKNGAIVAHDDRLLVDLSPQFGVDKIEDLENHKALQYLKMPQCQVIKGQVAVITAPGGETFFHWMTDALPKLFMLKQSNWVRWSEIDYFVVPQLNSFIVDSLKLLGIPREKLLSASPKLHIEASRLAVASPHGLTGWPPKWVIGSLKEHFLPLANSANTQPAKRIYISRSKASHRGVINELEVLQVLEKFGFKPIYLESLNLTQQIAVFAAAEAVVAPHGAGLTNIVWCSPKTKVLEIFSRNYVNVCFWSISNEANLDYYYILGKGVDPGDGIDPHAVSEDITIDLNDLQQALELLCES